MAARKFGNLMIFGCWWFLNNPSLIEEITRMRLELLGTTFIPQHSDARVLDQLLYKWDHSRQVIGKVLAEKYRELVESGWELSEQGVKEDVSSFFRTISKISAFRVNAVSVLHDRYKRKILPDRYRLQNRQSFLRHFLEGFALGNMVRQG